jgi:hypothetical protein
VGRLIGGTSAETAARLIEGHGPDEVFTVFSFGVQIPMPEDHDCVSPPYQANAEKMHFACQLLSDTHGRGCRADPERQPPVGRVGDAEGVELLTTTRYNCIVTRPAAAVPSRVEDRGGPTAGRAARAARTDQLREKSTPRGVALIIRIPTCSTPVDQLRKLVCSKEATLNLSIKQSNDIESKYGKSFATFF